MLQILYDAIVSRINEFDFCKNVCFCLEREIFQFEIRFHTCRIWQGFEV